MTEKAQVALDTHELRALIATVLELPVEDVTDDARFAEDLEVDSLTSLEIGIRLEERYGVTVGDQELKGIGSFPDVRELVESKLRDRRTP